MSFRKPFLCISIIFLLAFTNIPALNDYTIASPDNRISVTVFLSENGEPFYEVQFESSLVVAKSRLGFEFKNHSPINKNLIVSKSSNNYFNKTWQPVWGTNNLIQDEYNEIKLVLQTAEINLTIVNLIFRAYNDGVAFRYDFPEQDNFKSAFITDELTEINFIDDHNCWWIPGDYDSYEYLYNHTRISEIDLTHYNYQTRADRHHPNNHAVNTPVTLETKSGLYLSLHESNLTNYAGMTLEVINDYSFEVDLVPWADGIKVKTEVPFQTPWRTIQIAEKPEELLASNLILNLNEPNKIQDISWVKPMKYVGVWWEMHLGKSSWSLNSKKSSWANNSKYHGANTENVKRYIDFAAQNNIKGILVEGWNTGWEYWGSDSVDYFDFTTPYPDFDLVYLVNYAKSKGVELIGHHETGGQAESYDRRLEDAFEFYDNLGIRAVKTGYAGQIIPRGEFHHGQYMVQHYRKVLETAAKYKIMIDAHEPIMDTGIRRTYPNMMTREGVRGMEYNAWSRGNPPEHTTILPFTRMLAGPIDYTPGIFDLFFDKYKANERVYTTLAKQLALYIIIYSPLQMAADLPENYLGHPGFEFIKNVPVDWDKSVYHRSKIGDYVTISRKSGNNWYLGSITDEFARVLHFQLTFLDSGTFYKATIYKDGPGADWKTNPYSFTISEKIVDKNSTLRINLAKGGGQAIIFEPIGKLNEKIE